VPYTGSGAEASRKRADKLISKRIFEKSGVPTPAYEIVGSGEKHKMPLPLVIKPLRQGSSVGVHRIMSESDWTAAMSDTLKYGDEVLVETFIPGRELTAGIVGHEALPIVEIVAPDGWYDYRAKYTKGTSKYNVPAPIDDKTREACQRYALIAFDALGCRGLARVDFRLSPENKVYTLELNSIPGFTETSLLPKAASAAGITFPELCDRIMSLATTG
jgi:D-alanine--D-alanine ligase